MGCPTWLIPTPPRLALEREERTSSYRGLASCGVLWFWAHHMSFDLWVLDTFLSSRFRFSLPLALLLLLPSPILEQLLLEVTF